MADIIKLIKKQSEKSIAEIRVLSGKLSEQLKNVVNLIPENTRNKSVEEFLNDIRRGVLGESVQKASRRGRKPAAKKRTKKVGKTGVKKGRKKKVTAPAETA